MQCFIPNVLTNVSWAFFVFAYGLSATEFTADELTWIIKGIACSLLVFKTLVVALMLFLMKMSGVFPGDLRVK